MGHTASAAKRERQNRKRQARNRANKAILKKEIKGFLKVIQTDPANKSALDKVQSALDRSARKNAIPKKRASRKKSRLAKMATRLQKAAKTQA